jgi:hypothetical protein
MADTKISQLPSATTPLSGAELVPLVQSGATVQTPTNEISKLTAATANTFTANQIIEVTDNVNAALRVTQLGTADALRIEDSTNPDSTPFIVDASGNVGIGKTPVVTLDVAGQVRTMDGTVDLRMLPVSGSSAGLVGTLSNHAVVFTQNNAEAFRVDTSKNVLITGAGGLGYGTGSGGTVTQITSKGTTVTLNKTNGQIVMNAAALAAGASVPFQVNNTTVAANDVVVCNIGNFGNYVAQIYFVTATAFGVRVTNTSGGSLSEAVTINFAVIKAVTS